MQSKFMSALESTSNIILGLFISWSTWVIIITPFYKIKPSHYDIISISVIFTIMSFLRTYILRRVFNKVGDLKKVKAFIWRLKDKFIFSKCQYSENHKRVNQCHLCRYYNPSIQDRYHD